MLLHRLVLALSTLFLACLPLAADDELEMKLKTLTAAIGGSGVPDEFIKLRADFEHRSPPADAEEKNLSHATPRRSMPRWPRGRSASCA